MERPVPRLAGLPRNAAPPESNRRNAPSMNKKNFDLKRKQLGQRHHKLLQRPNAKQKDGNGIFDRYQSPVLTAEHTPLSWRYDFNHAANPHLMTRLGINSVFNVGAME